MRAMQLIRAVMPVALVAGWLIAAPTASAHTHVHIGEYELSIGWASEPTYVGVPNGVEITIEDPDGKPFNRLEAGAITVVVSAAGESTAALPLDPAFGTVTGPPDLVTFGTAGQYVANLLPTVPGDYTFQFAGSLDGLAVDVTVTSGDDTFSPVQASTDVEFPVKVPTLAEVAERLERIDGRIQDASAAAQASADAAVEAADRATLVGALGGAGLVVAVVALVVAWRLTRNGAGTA